jgi:hypothetical protein
MPDFSGKVVVRIPEMFFRLNHPNMQQAIWKKLYHHYMDLDDEAEPIKSWVSFDGRAMIYGGTVDESRWPLCPTVLG